MNEEIRKLKEIVDKSSNIVFFGGAGVSTESGIPDFRSANGLYNQKLGREVSPEEMISHTFYVNHPDQFFEFYRDKLIYEDAEPNDCHRALAKLVASFGNPETMFMHDWFIALTAASFGRIQFVNEPMTRYRQHGDNTIGASRNSLLMRGMQSLREKEKARGNLGGALGPTWPFFSGPLSKRTFGRRGSFSGRSPKNFLHSFG